MERSSVNIPVSDLKELILLLKNLGPEVCLRVRLQGEMWSEYFMRLTALIGFREDTQIFSGIVLEDPARNKTLIIRDLKRIIQFELDKRFKNYQPFIHYTVVLFESENITKKRP